MSLGALCAFWVASLVVGSARTSQADCSHPDRPTFAIAPASDQATDPATTRIRPTAPESPKPCTGPQCSGKSAPTQSSAAIPRIAVFAEAWAWLAADPRGDDSRSTPTWPADQVALPTQNPPSIFHPPRRSR